MKYVITEKIIQFLILFLNMLNDEGFLILIGTKSQILGPKNRNVSIPLLTLLMW